MTRLKSIYGGKPGRRGDMVHGIPPRLPQPPKPPKAPKPPKPVGQKKTDRRETKTVDDKDGDHQVGHSHG